MIYHASDAYVAFCNAQLQVYADDEVASWVVTVRQPIPVDAISQILNEVMGNAVDNGADSRSMPDHYVAVAHFVCYPGEYHG